MLQLGSFIPPSTTNMEPEEEVKVKGGFNFFRIIDPCSFQQRRLRIPNKFIANVGCTLSSPALLKVPSSKHRHWQVELKQHEGEFWFQNGWHEFMQHHSLRVSHLLVFRYDGNSHFTVAVFDTTACEICYPSDTDDDDDDDDDDRFTHETVPQLSVKQENQDEGSVEAFDFDPLMHIISDSDDDETCKCNYQPVARKRANTSCSADHASSKKRKTTLNQPSNPTCTATNKQMVMKPGSFTSVSRKEQALIEASKFSSVYPFCTVTMKPSHVHKCCVVGLPVGFAREHLKGDIKSVTVRVSDGRSWEVQYHNDTFQVRLRKGWKEFVLDNYLEEDDICIFELVSKRPWEFKVTIIRVRDVNPEEINSASKNLSCNSSIFGVDNEMDIDDTIKKSKLSDSKKLVENEEVPLMGVKNEKVGFCNAVLKPRRCTLFSEKWQAITAARMFTSVYPFCKVTMRSSHVHGKFVLYLPITFVRSYLKGDIQSVTLRDSDGKTWQVCYRPWKAFVSLKAGWKEFVLDNYLKEDDICIFELVDNKHWVFRVTIFRIQDSKLTKRILIQCKNLSCNPDHILGNRRLQHKYSQEERKFSDSKEQMVNEKAPFMFSMNNTVEFPNSGSESWKSASFTEKERSIIEAGMFTSIYPYCSVTMKPSYVHGKFKGRLPVVFTRAYLRINIQSLTLRVSDGRFWQVSCSSKNGQFTLNGGWKQFVLDNYLEEDDICIFEIVDKRLGELKVTLFRVQDPKSNKRCSALSKNSNLPLGNSAMYISDVKKKRKISNLKKQIENEDVTLIVNKSDKVNFPITGEPLSSELFLNPRGCTSLVEKQQAITAASVFTSIYPFCTVTMKPSHVHGLFVVNLPISFARSYLKDDIATVTLRVSDGKTWKVRYCSKRGQVMLKTGWKDFVLDNYLEEDDICIFELVDSKKWELKVTVFSIQDPEITKKVLTPCKNISRNPGCLLGAIKSQKEVSEEKGKPSDPKVKMGNEEAPFIVNRKDKMGNEEDPFIINTDDKSDFPNTCESITTKQLLQSGKFVPFSKAERLPIEARAFSSIYPYCSVILKPSHVHGQFMLSLPVAFSGAYLKNGIQSVTLRVSDGRVWQVRCSASNYPKFYKGWKEFVLDNYLEEGDICFFEVVDRKHMELKVTIFSVQDSERRKTITAQSVSSCLPGEIGMRNEDTGKKRKASDMKEEIENEEVPFMVNTSDNVDLPNTSESIIFTDPVPSSNRTDEENSISINMSVLKGLVANQEEDRDMAETTAFASDKPFCIVTIESSNVQGDFTLNLPKAFTTKYLKNAFDGVTLCISSGTRWHADLVSGDNCKLYKGWKEFVLDNNVKEGDVCLFELVDRDHIVLKVSIEHAIQHSKPEESEIFSYNFKGEAEGGGQCEGSRASTNTTSKDCTKQEIRKRGLSILQQKQEAQHVSVPSRRTSLQDQERLTEVARTFTSKNPFCVVIMRRSYVDGPNLTLPKSFSKTYLTKGNEDATLCSSDGRRCPVRIGFGESNVKLSRGWVKFVSDNQLEEDDICIFELVDRYHVELKVTIFRPRDLKTR